MKTSAKKQERTVLCPVWLWASLLLFSVVTGTVLILGWKVGGWFNTTVAKGQSNMSKGLIIVDIQHDFVAPKGSLSVFKDGDEKNKNLVLGKTSVEYIQAVNKYLDDNIQDFDFVVYSIDFHPEQHCSFERNPPNAYSTEKGSNHGGDKLACKTPAEETSQVLWPAHCKQTGNGWKLRSELKQVKPKNAKEFMRYPKQSEEDLVKNIPTVDKDQKDDFEDENPEVIEYDGPVLHMFKGLRQDEDSYSAFKGFVGTPTGLADFLKEKIHPNNDASDIELTVIGIAYDFCVGFTATDAADEGYKVKVLSDLSGPVGININEINKNFDEKHVSVNPKPHSQPTQ